MKYYDIKERLSIEIDMDEKITKYLANVFNILGAYEYKYIPFSQAFVICQDIGVLLKDVSVYPNDNGGVPAETFLKNILFKRGMPFIDFISRISVVCQMEFFKDEENKYLKTVAKDALSDCKLPYEMCEGIIIPKGVPELDQALVCDVADWLINYPSTKKIYKSALQQYFESDDFSLIADSLRKAFEIFLQEFFANKKNLEKNIIEVGKYLKEQGVNEEIRNMVATFISHYKLNNDKTAKHHDKTGKNVVEFLLYQTGVFIRLLLQVKESES